ncbi:MAG: hypothetical protein NZ898_09300 [Myxococcota bacterium]|nr:hypothetical protein [Myxococcota bacterium]MDW8361627.1 hypothetical protein [Myxococcales bacterium]
MAEGMHRAGELPEVRDEAPPSPRWLPLLGLTLLLLAGVFLAVRATQPADQATDTADAAPGQAAAPSEQAAKDQPAGADTTPRAGDEHAGHAH